MKLIFSAIMAFVLCYVAAAPVSAGECIGNEKKMIQAVCHVAPVAVMCVDYTKICKTPEHGHIEKGLSCHCEKPSSRLYVMEKCRFRVSRGKLKNSGNGYEKFYRPATLRQIACNGFRSISLIC